MREQQRTEWSEFQRSIYQPENPGVGPGELSAASALMKLEPDASLSSELVIDALNKVISGQSKSFDIEIPDVLTVNGTQYKFESEYVGKWEVKQPDTNRQIRPGRKGLDSLAKTYRKFEDLAWDINDFWSITCSEKTTLRSLLKRIGKPSFDAIDEYVKNDIPLILGGEFTAARALGKEAGTNSTQTFGLLQVVQSLRILDNKHSRTTQLCLSSHVIPLTLRVDQIIDQIDCQKKRRDVMRSMKVTRLDYLCNKILFKHDAFRDPACLTNMFKLMADPHSAFDGVRGIILVAPDGYSIIHKDDFDVLKFARVSQRKPKFQTPRIIVRKHS